MSISIQFRYLPVDAISPNPLRPRSQISRGSLLSLADSIRRLGILHPLLVGKTAAGHQLISGERRLRAAKLAGLDEVPVVIRKISSNRELALLSLAENIHREELNLIDQAKILNHARQNFKMELAEIADLTGLESEKLEIVLKTLDLPEEIKQKHLEGELDNTQLQKILLHEDPLEALYEI